MYFSAQNFWVLVVRTTGLGDWLLGFSYLKTNT